MSEGIKSKLGGRVLHSQSREIVSNVYRFMKDEAQKGTVVIPLSKARLRTSTATGVSERVVSNINSELADVSNISEGNGEKSFSTPNKCRSRRRPITDLDDFDKCVLRKLVYDFHLTEHRLPTAKLLFSALKEKINFKGCLKSLRLILKQLGFKWRRIQNNRKILVETCDIREKRLSYLRALKRFREENRPIVYLDESYVLSSHVSSKTWSDNSNNGVRVPVSKGERLIIIHAGGEKGFVPNALTMWITSHHSGDCHDMMKTYFSNG